jgi:hypothetical protein
MIEKQIMQNPQQKNLGENFLESKKMFVLL